MNTRQSTVEIYIDGKRSDIPEDASYSFVWGYALEVIWHEPTSVLRRRRMYFNYRCLLDGVPIKQADVEAANARGYHKLEMFTATGSRVINEGEMP